jgi:hypothetical protein
VGCSFEHLTFTQYVMHQLELVSTLNKITDTARFFLEPVHPRQRQYEALRAFFVEQRASGDVAQAFGYTPGSFRVLCHHFRRDAERAFFADPRHGPQDQPKKSRARRLIIEMRKRNLSVYDIERELAEQHIELSATAITEVLREEGFARLPRRADEERPNRVRPEIAARADVRHFLLNPGTFETRVGGLFVLLPLLVQLGIDQLAGETALPGTQAIPAVNALLSSLALKLTSLERKGHVMDLVFDQGLSLFAGLNVVPKTTFLWQYSNRLSRSTSVRILQAWLKRLRAHMKVEGGSFNLDFHAVPFFGQDEFIERHYISKRSRRDKAVLTFVAQDADADVICYTNADLRKGEENDEVLRFVDFWKEAHGCLPAHLVFDSKLTTFANLARLDSMGITFITLRRRSNSIKRHVLNSPAGAWRQITLEVPHRKYRSPKVLDQSITLPKRNGYAKPLRQICVRDLGHEEPTILITNDMRSTSRTLLERYARRMLIENDLEDQVHFFHLDALSSAVAMKVDFDVALTVIATGLYRLLGKHLHGFEHAKARQIFRRFLDTPATVDVAPTGVRVRLPRRAHNPLLLESGVLSKPVVVPWWGGATLEVAFP